MQSFIPNDGLPFIFFQIGSAGLELLNGSWEDYPGMSPSVWKEIAAGGWETIVPQEYHPQVRKLASLSAGQSYQVVEFPVIWQEQPRWLHLFVAALEEPRRRRKIVGFAQQDFTAQRESFSHGNAAQAEETEDPGTRGGTRGEMQDEAEDPVTRLCHDISGPLTSILINSELVLDEDCPGEIRSRTEAILTEALQINQSLRASRKGSAP